MTPIRATLTLATLTATLSSFPASAQHVPDAGQILREQQQELPQVPRTPSSIDLQQPAMPATEPGGPQVIVRSVSIGGISVFPEPALLAVLGDVEGKPFDLAGLRGLAERIAAHYRRNGYPFTRAYLPEQALSDGTLRIEVIEGRYGAVQAEGDEADKAQAFLEPLVAGNVIESTALERTTLILDDQPGFKTTPIIRPGKELGTADLDVRVRRERMVSGEVGIDNQGNRYTGEYRGRLNLQFDSPFLYGDQIQLRSLVTDEALWQGALNYSLPVGGSGLRGTFGYSQTSYQLGKQFAKLLATGKAYISTLGASYPLLRSQKANLTLGASFQFKKLEDGQGASGSQNVKSSRSLPVSAQFDIRDGFLGGGVTYGTVSWTHGRLSLDDTLLAIDSASARTEGGFNKTNLDLARLQALPANVVAFARVSVQWADKNLDSSEGFGLGGANGVRAYPTGESYGDEGWLTQFELRYPIGTYTPFLFHDAGHIRTNHRTWDNSMNTRSISGSGLGVRYQTGAWLADTTVAWRGQGGRPESDTAKRDPRLWMTLSYRF
ncbi:ShlB/FhaC/HecB family hemolysin secretion/activation protein [uncultured Propionivibrio sp.]|uniref:ShlB/FhaC/HecB family hemolysin secretion/activation protein n=1 Tax=uncultured Propionivibrio sp. TaxID=426737 RepID=UPI0029BFC62F|nr:ShlB/FhaC/HecB family hemolysin secretion/activation protein [uncultured Propionivibrio sp.]